MPEKNQQITQEQEEQEATERTENKEPIPSSLFALLSPVLSLIRVIRGSPS
jgi:hypothetical protein